MKEHLFPTVGQFYKANLHAHTTVSDGKMTPEELKAAYLEKGYSIVAFTDHDVMVDHSELSDRSFLALRGYEIAVEDARQHEGDAPFCHLSLIAESTQVERQVFFTKNIAFHGNAAAFASSVLTTGEPIYSYHYSPVFVNRLIRAARAAGFLPILNHPSYSLGTEADLLPLEGLFGMEIHNGASLSWGFGDDGSTVLYERMLRGGHTSLLPIAADDTHTSLSCAAPGELFAGFMMIKAQTLSYPAVIAALKAGDCYASQGPQLLELSVEEGRLHVECSRVREILYRTAGRGAMRRASADGLTSADFAVSASSGYFRLELVDGEGRRAVTRAYPVARYGR